MLVIRVAHTKTVQSAAARSSMASRNGTILDGSLSTMPISEADFRAEAQAFLDANAKPRPEVSTAWGESSDKVGLLTERSPEEELEELRAAKEWRAQVFDAGFGWISGPAQYGGRELPSSYERIWTAL